jgi:hypothetical protein
VISLLGVFDPSRLPRSQRNLTKIATHKLEFSRNNQPIVHRAQGRLDVLIIAMVSLELTTGV